MAAAGTKQPLRSGILPRANDRLEVGTVFIGSPARVWSGYYLRRSMATLLYWPRCSN